MTTLSDHDWEQINAWADGELSGAEAQAFARRLESEPALAEALASVRQITSSLSAMRPEPGHPTIGANANRRPWVWAAGALGASVAAAITVVAVVLWSGAEPGAIDVHRDYAAQEFPLEAQPDTRPVAASAVDGFPLLRDANLYLVATEVTEGRASAHFVGLKGCRLTVLRGDYAPAQVSQDVQARQWVADDIRYQMVATGMDVNKFSAAAAYLEQATQNRLLDSTVLALLQAVQSATNCRLSLG